MAFNAQRNEILLGVIPRSAAKFSVMDLQVLEFSAGLAPPSIPLPDL
jgi:hypothetical protein